MAHTQRSRRWQARLGRKRKTQSLNTKVMSLIYFHIGFIWLFVWGRGGRILNLYYNNNLKKNSTKNTGRWACGPVTFQKRIESSKGLKLVEFDGFKLKTWWILANFGTRRTFVIRFASEKFQSRTQSTCIKENWYFSLLCRSYLNLIFHFLIFK